MPKITSYQQLKPLSLIIAVPIARRHRLLLTINVCPAILSYQCTHIEFHPSLQPCNKAEESFWPLSPIQLFRILIPQNYNYPPPPQRSPTRFSKISKGTTGPRNHQKHHFSTFLSLTMKTKVFVVFSALVATSIAAPKHHQTSLNRVSQSPATFFEDPCWRVCWPKVPRCPDGWVLLTSKYNVLYMLTCM